MSFEYIVWKLVLLPLRESCSVVGLPVNLLIIFADILAVLMLDDDTLVSVPDISFAFSVWKVIPVQHFKLKC